MEKLSTILGKKRSTSEPNLKNNALPQALKNSRNNSEYFSLMNEVSPSTVEHKPQNSNKAPSTVQQVKFHQVPLTADVVADKLRTFLSKGGSKDVHDFCKELLGGEKPTHLARLPMPLLLQAVNILKNSKDPKDQEYFNKIDSHAKFTMNNDVVLEGIVIFFPLDGDYSKPVRPTYHEQEVKHNKEKYAHDKNAYIPKRMTKGEYKALPLQAKINNPICYDEVSSKFYCYNAKNDETIELQFGDTAKVEDLIKKIKSEEMVTHVKMTEVFKKNFPTTDMQTPKNNAGYKFFKYYELASDHHVHVWGYQFPQVSNQPQSANTSNTSAAVVDDSLFAHHCEVKLNNKEIEEAITNTIPSAQSEFKEWSNAQDAKEANINQANANNVAVPQNSSNSSPKVSQISDQSNNNPNPSTIVSKKSENSLSQSQNGSLSQIPQKNSLVGSNLEGSRGSEVN